MDEVAAGDHAVQPHHDDPGDHEEREDLHQRFPSLRAPAGGLTAQQDLVKHLADDHHERRRHFDADEEADEGDRAPIS